MKIQFDQLPVVELWEQISDILIPDRPGGRYLKRRLLGFVIYFLEFRTSYLIKNKGVVNQAIENALSSVLVVSNDEDGEILYEGDLQII